MWVVVGSESWLKTRSFFNTPSSYADGSVTPAPQFEMVVATSPDLIEQCKAVRVSGTDVSVFSLALSHAP